MTLKRTSEQALQTRKGIMSTSSAKTLDVPKAKSLNGDHSLDYMMSARRSGLQSLHKKFAEEMEQRRRVSFEAKEENPVDEPPFKRRRFQRRNSKTASMLFSSMSTFISTDFGESDKEQEPKVTDKTSDDAWDGGVQIAEELVRHLGLRRQSLNGSVS